LQIIIPNVMEIINQQLKRRTKLKLTQVAMFFHPTHGEMIGIARIATGGCTGLSKEAPGAPFAAAASDRDRATKVAFPGPFLQSQAAPAVAAVDTRGIFGTVVDVASLLESKMTKMAKSGWKHVEIESWVASSCVAGCSQDDFLALTPRKLVPVYHEANGIHSLRGLWPFSPDKKSSIFT
jgi:hypothetical protein